MSSKKYRQRVAGQGGEFSDGISASALSGSVNSGAVHLQ